MLGLGCNPIDIRRDKRQELKKKLKKEGKYNNKRQRLIDSDDEELALFTYLSLFNVVERLIVGLKQRKNS